MSFSHLPPQAYTRDVLAAAYEWMRSQPQSIRELATSSDNLVSLYVQSRRRPGSLNHLATGEAKIDQSTPSNSMNVASAEAFKNDLKSLAEGLKQFEDTDADMTILSQPMPVSPALPVMPPPPLPTHSNSTAKTPSGSAPAPTNNSAILDARTLETLRKVQSLLNLSSEREALRMLVAVGYEKIKSLVL